MILKTALIQGVYVCQFMRSLGIEPITLWPHIIFHEQFIYDNAYYILKNL